VNLTGLNSYTAFHPILTFNHIPYICSCHFYYRLDDFRAIHPGGMLPFLSTLSSSVPEPIFGLWRLTLPNVTIAIILPTPYLISRARIMVVTPSHTYHQLYPFYIYYAGGPSADFLALLRDVIFSDVETGFGRQFTGPRRIRL